ncbi:hypothetical protein AB0758_33295 [Tolypothrix bouteillei VB521301_2]
MKVLDSTNDSADVGWKLKLGIWRSHNRQRRLILECMSDEENLQSMANDLEGCSDIEMFRFIKEAYNTEALKVASLRISRSQTLNK